MRGRAIEMDSERSYGTVMGRGSSDRGLSVEVYVLARPRGMSECCF